VVLLGIAACGQSPATGGQGRGTPAEQPQVGARDKAAPVESSHLDASAAQDGRPAADELPGPLAEALGLDSAGLPLPKQLELGGDCPDAGADADAAIAAQAASQVPLKVGLTLTNVWTPNADEEYECLTQVTAVSRGGIDATVDCNKPGSRRSLKRRLCRADLDSARILMTEIGTLTVIDASGEEVPETAVGATWFSLSRREFAELKRTGATRHHYVQPNSSGDGLEVESTAELHLEGSETARVAVNDRIVEIPVIRVSGAANHRLWGQVETGRVTALVMDDEKFPFLVDYSHTTGSGDAPHFRLNHTKISYPDPAGETSNMERLLATEKRIDVYGIYFDFNSDRIRKESTPILEEIAGVLDHNPDWKLGIHGHTDSVGGSEYNLELSRRRSEAVRQALVLRFGISSERLTTAGFGAAAPKDSNDTPEGRARNRRVELVRQ
jgi:outer membrane protein OmpA-like peptidoglycan-associated protein